MELLALLGIGLLIAVLVVPWIAIAKAGSAQAALAKLDKELRSVAARLNEAMAQIAALNQTIKELQSHDRVATEGRTPSQDPVLHESFPSAADQFAVARTAAKTASVGEAPAILEPTPIKPAFDDGLTLSEWTMPTASEKTSEKTLEISQDTSDEKEITQPLSPIKPAIQSARQPTPPRRPIPAAPRAPSDFEVQMGKWIAAGKEWLFGGNLVAKVGLLILFIGVAFLVRLASNYVTVPVEFRLAGVAAGALALLVWGWRIRESRRGIALPAQGAALAILMLVTFGAFKLFHVLPAGATFAMLFILVAFTCVLAVLQDAIWLAVFGIAGGFAAPILVSTGSGNHIALFSYYCLLNAGVLAIALKRSWRGLNLLGFAFTFIVAAAWGEQRYLPENYLSSELFLIAFWLFYIAIAILFAWRRAPLLKSYVDGTLVFGVPMAGMALQYGLVKDIEYGMSISALCVALTYAITASTLWHWRRGNLRLLVESFLALALVFGTLAIPLAFDGRWTSAAWAVEGAAIVWVGLRQKQKLAWQFGVVVQLGSWISFLSALTDLNPLAALRGNIGLGFLLLGVTGVLMALMFRRDALNRSQEEISTEEKSRQRFGWMAGGFICVAVVWLLLGLWAEVWSRLSGAHRASMLVLTALALVFGLQWLSKKSAWRLPEVLSATVAAIAGVVFALLMFEHMDWRNHLMYTEQSFGELLTNGPLLGGLMLCAGALISALAFKNRVATITNGNRARAEQTATTWLLVAVFWWCGFALHGIAHAVAYLTSTHTDESATPWYSISFWAAYGIGLSLSALAWTTIAVRRQFPNLGWMRLAFWPTVTALGGFAFWIQVHNQLWWSHLGATLAHGTIGDAWLTLAGGPLSGALILCALAWHGVLRISRGEAPVNSYGSSYRKSFGTAIWMIGLGLIWYSMVVDAVTLFTATVLEGFGTANNHSWWQLDYAQVVLLLEVASGMGFLLLATRKQLPAMRWLALPAAMVQALASVALLVSLYLEGTLPSVGTGIALLGCWLGVAWCLRYWQAREWRMPSWSLRLLHFGRVIAPWMAIAPLVSLATAKWLSGGSTGNVLTVEEGWIFTGLWSDYLSAWVSIGSLLLLLRQVKVAGWPLRPLETWYEERMIPLATLWGVLLAMYWNLRQDGNMAPLPYLPLLNPLDITTGFVALLVAMVWQANKSIMEMSTRRLGVKVAMALSFGWFNLMLLRTAAHYLHLPYRFSALYASQFIQAMLSIVWTLTAFMLMRYAVRKLSKPLWMVGAALLVVVVAKLALIDLSNSGSIARIVSFMGVGGLMLVIGYLAPLPRRDADATEEEKEST
jgi:uncharacterized membrane protein